MRGQLLIVFLALLLRHHQAGAESYHCVSFEYPPLISLSPGSAEPSGFAVVSSIVICWKNTGLTPAINDADSHSMTTGSRQVRMTAHIGSPPPASFAELGRAPSVGIC